MKNEGPINQIRCLNFILGLLKNQQDDPLCSNCLSFAKNTELVKGKFMEFEKAFFSLSGKPSMEFEKQFKRLYELISSIREPDNPIGQRKTGNCNFPEKVCIVQESVKFFEKLIL
jgi:hypothetical protein